MNVHKLDISPPKNSDLLHRMKSGIAASELLRDELAAIGVCKLPVAFLGPLVALRSAPQHGLMSKSLREPGSQTNVVYQTKAARSLGLIRINEAASGGKATYFQITDKGLKLLKDLGL